MSKKVKLKNRNGEYLYPYTDNIPTASTTTAGKVKLDGSAVSGSMNAITSGAVYTALSKLEQKEHSIYQTLSVMSGVSVDLNDNISIYRKETAQNITLTFNGNALTKKQNVITFELYLILTADGLTITCPSTVIWLSGEAPDTSKTQKYLFAFRSFDSGATWIGNLQGVYA